MGKRILFLGITGIDKSNALDRLGAHCLDEGREIHKLNFEKEFLFSDDGAGDTPRGSFLVARPAIQREAWERGWSRLLEALPGDDARDIALSMHGCYIRGHYGSRWILDANEVAAFKPDLIVTLIADVYDLWWRTESRAQGQDWKGRPTLNSLCWGGDLRLP